jgi:hypothetical protein
MTDAFSKMDNGTLNRWLEIHLFDQDIDSGVPD